MQCEKVYGQLYCGYDNILMDDNETCNKEGIYGDIPDYFPEEPKFDDRMYDLLGRELSEIPLGTMYIQNRKLKIRK